MVLSLLARSRLALNQLALPQAAFLLVERVDLEEQGPLALSQRDLSHLEARSHQAMLELSRLDPSPQALLREPHLSQPVKHPPLPNSVEASPLEHSHLVHKTLVPSLQEVLTHQVDLVELSNPTQSLPAHSPQEQPLLQAVTSVATTTLLDQVFQLSQSHPAPASH